MKLFNEKNAFKAAMRGYAALGGSRADMDTFRLDVIGASLYHGLAFANFDAGAKVVAATLGAIRPDVERALSECREAWEENDKSNFNAHAAEERAHELLQPVIAALRELRDTQDRAKEEKKQAKEAEARAAALAKMESEANGKPSPFVLKNGEAGGSVELTEGEYNTLVGLLADIRKGDRPVTVDVSKRVAVAA